MKRFKALAVFMCLALVAAALTAVPALAASKGNLVKEYSYKEQILKKGKWKLFDSKVKYSKNAFKYNKKNDPVKITTTDFFKSGAKKSSAQKIKYTYIKGKKVKKVVGNSTTTYKGGVPTSLRIDYGDGYGRSFGYKFKSRYATYVLFRDLDSNEETGYSFQTKNSFTVNLKGGLPADIWSKDNLNNTFTFYTSGVKKGLIKKAVVDNSVLEEDGSYTTDKSVYKYTYTVNKGKVTKVVRTCTYTYRISGNAPSVTKYKTEFNFKYAKKKADKKRFAAMLNDIVANAREIDSYDRPVIYTYWY